MGSNRQLFEDQWGEVIDRPGPGYLEIRWYDSTVDLNGEGFKSWLARFAGFVEEQRPAGVLVDAIQFKMDPANMSLGWRDEHIIPRYNRAGLKRFAFHMPGAMPAIGAPPAPEGPADFPTAYFATRREAVTWLAGGTIE